MSKVKVYVIGVGPDSLSQQAIDLLQKVEVIFSARRFNNLIPGTNAEIISITPIKKVIEYIKLNYKNRSIAVLTSGDPLFFGIGRKLIDELGGDPLRFIPAVSSMQIAFSSIKESWNDAMFVSLHGRQDDIASLILPFKKVCILTDEINNPSVVAGVLLDEGIEDFRAYVCEDMGTANERVTAGTLSDIRDISFSPLNVMILVRDKIHTSSFGLRESDFSHTAGLITKDEIRAVTISRLKPPKEGVLWDIGAGSGSVSIEAAMLSARLRIYAIEKDPVQVGHIRKNRRRFGAFNVKPVHNEAPDALLTLPRPDRVFIGGTGGRLNEILDVVLDRLNGPGPVIVNAATIDTMNDALRVFETKGFNTDLTTLQVSRSKQIGGKRHLYALNPIFIITGEKG